MLNSFSFALKSIKNHKLRTALTVLAISIGISAVIIVVSAGAGLKSLINGQMDAFGSDLIQVETRVPRARKNVQGQMSDHISGITIATLKDSDREAILKEVHGISSAYSAVIDQEQVVRDENRKKAIIFGVSSTLTNVDSAAEIEQGRMFTQDEDKGLALEAVLGAGVKDALFGDSDAAGKTIKIKKLQFKVIGVLKKRGAVSFFNFDDIIYIPLNTLQKRIAGLDHISMISIKGEEGSNLDSTKKQIENILRERHNISDPDKDDFAVTTMEEAKEMINTVLGAVKLFLLAIAGISLLVGGIGIMNVMYVSVKERTFEIGLRKSLGAKYKDILSQFLLEALMLSFLGAVLGIAIGALASFAIAFIAVSKGFSWKLTVSSASIFVSVIFSSCVGILFGYWPAKTAAKKEAIKALADSAS